MSIDKSAVRKLAEEGRATEAKAQVSSKDVQTWAQEFAEEFLVKAKEILGKIPETARTIDYVDKIGINVVGLSAVQAVLTNAARNGNFEAFEELFRLGVEVGILYGTVTEREKHNGNANT